MNAQLSTSPLFILIPFLFMAGYAMGDELFISSGREMKTAQRTYVEDRIKKLRDSNYETRFEVIRYLIDLDRTALPVIAKELDRNSNPMPVRCMLLALSEIGGMEAVTLLNQVIADSGAGRDESMAATLGLGKLEGAVDLDGLRSLLDSGVNRDVRKTAALALARKKDGPSAARMIKYLKSEKDKEFSAILILSACMIGGEELAREMPRLFKTSKEDRRRLLTLGATFLADPVLLPLLMKYGAKSDKIEAMLALCLGCYNAGEAIPLLGKIAKGEDARAGEDALYSLSVQNEKEAAPIFEAILQNARHPSVKAHCILALADVGKGDRYLGQIHKALQDRSAQVRSAAALALRHSRKGETPMRLGEALTVEKEPVVAGDLLLAIGLVGGTQYLDSVRTWMERPQTDPDLQRTAQRVFKVLTGKMDPQILREQYQERLSQLSAKWHYRFRDRVMEELHKGLGLDKIIRRDTSGEGAGVEIGSGEAGGANESGGSSEGVGEGGEEGAQPAESAQPGDDTGGKKKFLFRYEVIEWDLLQWFNHYPYFSETCFTAEH